RGRCGCATMPTTRKKKKKHRTHAVEQPTGQSMPSQTPSELPERSGAVNLNAHAIRRDCHSETGRHLKRSITLPCGGRLIAREGSRLDRITQGSSQQAWQHMTDPLNVDKLQARIIVLELMVRGFFANNLGRAAEPMAEVDRLEDQYIAS